MGQSSPSIHLEREPLDSEEFSDISGVFNPAPELPLARWTLAQSDDWEAPEVICEVVTFDEESARLQARYSRSIGHGLRPVHVGGKVEISNEPSVVVTIYL